jgi:hypothetical protein
MTDGRRAWVIRLVAALAVAACVLVALGLAARYHDFQKHAWLREIARTPVQAVEAEDMRIYPLQFLTPDAGAEIEADLRPLLTYESHSDKESVSFHEQVSYNREMNCLIIYTTQARHDLISAYLQTVDVER